MGVCIYKTGGAKESIHPRDQRMNESRVTCKGQFWVGKELAKMMMRLWTRHAGVPSGLNSDGH